MKISVKISYLQKIMAHKVIKNKKSITAPSQSGSFVIYKKSTRVEV